MGVVRGLDPRTHEKRDLTQEAFIERSDRRTEESWVPGSSPGTTVSIH
jgi:hypothetical protein